MPGQTALPIMADLLRADILLYVIRFADKAGIDLETIAERKIALNAEKYPPERFRGSDRKYDE